MISSVFSKNHGTATKKKPNSFPFQQIALRYFTTRSDKHFKEYYEKFRNYAYTAAYSILSNRDLAEEVVSEVFMKMWNTTTFEYDHTKSHAGFIMLASTNKAKMMRNRVFNKSKSFRKLTKSIIDSIKDEYWIQVEHVDTKFNTKIKMWDEPTDDLEFTGTIKLKHKDCGMKFGIDFDVLDYRSDFGMTICTICNPIDQHDLDESKNRRTKHDLNIKIRPTLLSESQFVFEENDEMNDILDYSSMKNDGLLIIENYNIQEITDMISEPTIHDDVEMQCERLLEMIDEIGENSELLIDAMIYEIPYNDIVKKYDLNSTGAVKSRVFRSKQKIMEKMGYEVEHSKISVDTTIDTPITTFHDSGNNKVNCNRKNGKLDGMYIEYYNDGKLKQKCCYKNGKFDGKFIEFHEDGKLKQVGEYENGKKVGKWETYREDGSKDEVCVFIDKVRHYKIFDEFGVLEHHGVM